jgi:alpha-amylase
LTASTSGGSSSCTVPAPSKTTELAPCQTWSLDSCAGNQTNYPSAGYDERKWQTPARNGSDYVTTFQDYRELTGYADITYNADRTSAVVTIQAFSRTCQPILYSFGGGKASSSNTYTVTSTATGTLSVVVTIPSVNATLTLDRK